MRSKSLNRLTTDYLAGLRAYLEQPAPAGLQTAHDLGAAAVAGCLETLDLAKIHEQALASLLLEHQAADDARVDLTTRAQEFFTEAIIPLEGLHRLAREASQGLRLLTAALARRTWELAASRQALQKQLAGRRKAEATLETQKAASASLLKDSRLLEQHLQHAAHEVLSTIEADRKRLSQHLNDEIAQALVAIQLQMLALKKEVATSHANLALEIASTERLVDKSVAILSRLAYQFSNHDE